MSSPKVLRRIADVVEVLPGAIGQLACSGLALLLIGGCAYIIVRDDPMSRWVLGGIVAYLVVPGILRSIADAAERRAADSPVEERDADRRQDSSPERPVRRLRGRDRKAPTDFGDEE